MSNTESHQHWIVSHRWWNLLSVIFAIFRLWLMYFRFFHFNTRLFALQNVSFCPSAGHADAVFVEWIFLHFNDFLRRYFAPTLIRSKIFEEYTTWKIVATNLKRKGAKQFPFHLRSANSRLEQLQLNQIARSHDFMEYFLVSTVLLSILDSRFLWLEMCVWFIFVSVRFF